MSQIAKEEKKIISFDESHVAGEIAYGYSNKKEAIKAIEEETGEKPDIDNMQKIRVMSKLDKASMQVFYYWGDECHSCGRKNDGVLSWADLS